MSDPLTDLINDIQQNGIRWVTLVTIYALYRKERRNYRLDRRDEALFHDLKILMEERGLGDQWRGCPNHGFKTMDLPSLKRYFLLSQVDMKHQKRRMNMLTNPLKSSISKKLLALLIGAAVAVLNKRFNLELSPEEVVGFFILVMSYILGQSHVDAKKVLAGIKDSPLLNMGFTEAIPVLSEIHSGINNLLADVKKNDNSQAFKDAMQAYAQIKPILDALKHPDPVAIIPEEQVSE